MVSIYVGNLLFKTTSEEVRSLFEQHGEVVSVKLITDRDSGRPKGYGFVEMSDETAANNAVEQLNGMEFGGRMLKVNISRERETNSRY